LTRQSFAAEITCDFARFVNFRQRQARQWQPRWCMRDWRFRFDFGPTITQFAREFFIRPRPLHLFENELVIILNRLNDLSKFAHKPPTTLLSFRAESRNLSLLAVKDVSTHSTSLRARLSLDMTKKRCCS